MSGVSPSSEQAAVTTAFHLSWSGVERLVTNAIDAGFAPAEDRARVLATQVRPWFAAR